MVGSNGALLPVETADSEEVLQLLGEMAVAIGGFDGWHGGCRCRVFRIMRSLLGLMPFCRWGVVVGGDGKLARHWLDQMQVVVWSGFG